MKARLLKRGEQPRAGMVLARGAINSLMGELMEDHILNHMPRKTKSSTEAAEDLIEIVRTYLK